MMTGITCCTNASCNAGDRRDLLGKRGLGRAYAAGGAEISLSRSMGTDQSGLPGNRPALRRLQGVGGQVGSARDQETRLRLFCQGIGGNEGRRKPEPGFRFRV